MDILVGEIYVSRDDKRKKVEVLMVSSDKIGFKFVGDERKWGMTLNKFKCLYSKK